MVITLPLQTTSIRTNRIIKEHFTRKECPGLRPYQLYSAAFEQTTTRNLDKSPFEIIMSLPGTIDLRKADVHLTSDSLVQYCERLSFAVE